MIHRLGRLSSSFRYRFAARQFTSKPNVLTRDFIHSCLYNESNGYFSCNEVIHGPSKQIPFHELVGCWEYKKVLSQYYKNSPTAWMTPVEIFSPWYSYAIAQYIMDHHSSTDKNEILRIYEIGGGLGTNARYILDYLQTNSPELYEHTEYRIIEISKKMSMKQKENVCQTHAQCQIIRQDFLDLKNMQQYSCSDKCFVIALEVFDNLPQDKICLQDGKWYETWVGASSDHPGEDSKDQKGKYIESYHPLQDKLISETMQYFPPKIPLIPQRESIWKTLLSFNKQPKTLYSAFIPTGIMQFLHVLKSCFPQHFLVAADFDYLPTPTFDPVSTIQPMHHPQSPTSTTHGSLAASNAPLVASRYDADAYDHDSYLIDDGSVDILFGTDFNSFQLAYSTYMKRSSNQVSIMKSSLFMEKYAKIENTQTRSGYNPLLEDFVNTSFGLSVI